MRKSIAFLVALGLSASAAAQQPAPGSSPFTSPYAGSWLGTLVLPGGHLRLGLLVNADASGTLGGYAMSPDQGSTPIPLTYALHGDTLVASISAVNASYAGLLAADSLHGTFTQNGHSTPLTLGRIAALPGAPIFDTTTKPTFPTRLAPNDSVRRLLAHRIDDLHRAHAMVVGILEPGGKRRFITYGMNDVRAASGATGARAPDSNTVFEIGSNTKVFTSLLLAEMVRRGDVRLGDPVAKYLPDLAIPQRDGRQITLVDLATHTSGLPRLPTNMPMKNPRDPYADYTQDELNAFLKSYVLPRDPGAQYEYSNLGVGLLGQALAHRAGTDYATAVRTRVLEPLGLDDTRATLTPSMQARAAQGHDAALAPTPYWNLPVFAGAGALRSTANDLLDFLAAELGERPSPLAPAMADMLAVRRPVSPPVVQVGLGWHIATYDGHEIVFHDGETGGFSSFMAFDRKRQVGIVIWGDSAVPEGVADLGLFLLNGGGRLYAGSVP